MLEPIFVKLTLMQAKLLMEYLSTRPYKEVAQGISWLATSIQKAEEQNAAAHSEGEGEEPAEAGA